MNREKKTISIDCLFVLPFVHLFYLFVCLFICLIWSLLLSFAKWNERFFSANVHLVSNVSSIFHFLFDCLLRTASGLHRHTHTHIQTHAHKQLHRPLPLSLSLSPLALISSLNCLCRKFVCLCQSIPIGFVYIRLLVGQIKQTKSNIEDDDGEV